MIDRLIFIFNLSCVWQLGKAGLRMIADTLVRLKNWIL